MDLTDRVTVFVTTIGDRAFPHCINALDRQDSRFRFATIENVAPMSAAFQQMLDDCETPFFVQVDEDMILDPYAIRILYDAMTNSPPITAIYCYSLWDEHMQQSILGVKIYRHEIVKQFPYRHDVPNCDVEQNDRLKAAGYEVKICWLAQQRNLSCIGVHGRHYTPETAYEAYYNRAAKSRLNPDGMALMRWLPAEFRRRIAADPNDLIDLYALMGFEAGMNADIAQFKTEKDHRTINHAFRRCQADLDTAPPSELNLHVTSRCNLKCQWCPRQTGTVEPKPDMTAEMVELALSRCPSIRSVCIAGLGEPLLCSTLEEIVATCKKRNLYVGLITNGVLLCDFAKVLAAWKVDSLSVSLNASNAESHRATTGADTWGRVMTGIREAAGPFRGRLAVSMVCHQGNVAEMPAFLELAAKMDIQAVDFLTMLPKTSPIGDEYHNGQLLRSHPEAHRVRTWPADMTAPCPRACLSPYQSISMDAEGWLSPCRRVLAPSRAFGHIKGPYLPWKLPATYKLRAELEGDQPLRECCRQCFAAWMDA